MAEKINIGAKEPLYKAAEKINNAMDEVNTFQAQIDQLVIKGDSSVEAAQARVDAEGNAYGTLKERLDTEYQSVTAQLAQTDHNLNEREINVLKPPVPLVAVTGDFVTDDSQALQNLANYLSSNRGGKLLVPTGKYLFKNEFILPNNVFLIGVSVDKNGYNEEHGVYFKFDVDTTENIDGIRIPAGVFNAGIKYVYVDGGKTAYNGIHIAGTEEQFTTHIQLENIFVAHTRNNGIYGTNTYLLTMDKVQSQFNEQDGFAFFGVGTTLDFRECYSLNNGRYGYRVEGSKTFRSIHYSQFSGCAADGNRVGYFLKNCSTITFTGTGTEMNTDASFELNNVENITLISPFVDRGNYKGVGTSIDPSFMKIVNSKGVTVVGGKDNNPQAGNASISIDENSAPVILINCTFPNSINDKSGKSVIIDDKIKIGQLRLDENLFASTIATFQGRSLANVDRRLGVVKNENSQLSWLGFISANGEIESTTYIKPGARSELPAASEALRGKIIRIERSNSLDDSLHICIRKGDGSYGWKQINLT